MSETATAGRVPAGTIHRVRIPSRRWIAGGLLVAALVILAMHFVDRPLARTDLTPTPEVRKVVHVVTVLGEAQWPLAVFAVFWLVCLVRQRRGLADAAVRGMIAIAIGGLSVNIIKIIVGRYRPSELIEDGRWGFEPLTYGYATASFPSGHSTVVAAACMSAYLAVPRLWPVWLIGGLCVCYTRLATTSHYLSDVIAGIALGVIVSLLVARVLPSKERVEVARVPSSA